MRQYRYWHRPSYWRWLWGTRVPLEAKLCLLLLSLGGLALAGFWLAGTTSGRSAQYDLRETTVQELVTVERAGRLVTTRVPVVRTVRALATTRYVDRVATRLGTVTTPGGLVVRTTVAERRVPVVVRRVVTEGGPTRTLTQTAERVVTQTRTQVVTDREVERQTQTVRETIVDTVPVTVMRTVTEPAVTVVETRSVPVTVTETAVVTETVTVKR